MTRLRGLSQRQHQMLRRLRGGPIRFEKAATMNPLSLLTLAVMEGHGWIVLKDDQIHATDEGLRRFEEHCFLIDTFARFRKRVAT